MLSKTDDDDMQVNPSNLFDLLIGAQNVYWNEHHNIALDGLDSTRDVFAKLSPLADVTASDLERVTGGDYSNPHTFIGAVDGSIAMHSGALRVLEYTKIMNFLGNDIHVVNYFDPTGAYADVGADFTRYGRGNTISNVKLNGQLHVAGGSRDNTANDLRFIGQPRPVIQIANDASDPTTEINLFNVKAPIGAYIVADDMTSKMSR